MNTHHLKFHFQDIFVNSNLLTSHILCLNETNIENIHDDQEKNVLLDKFEKNSSYNQHGMTMLHDKTMFLLENITMTNYRIEFIEVFKNRNTQ